MICFRCIGVNILHKRADDDDDNNNSSSNTILFIYLFIYLSILSYIRVGIAASFIGLFAVDKE
jgi:hypothetical protein